MTGRTVILTAASKTALWEAIAAFREQNIITQSTEFTSSVRNSFSGPYNVWSVQLEAVKKRGAA